MGLYALLGDSPADLADRWRRPQAWTPNGALDGVGGGELAVDTLTGTAEGARALVGT